MLVLSRKRGEAVRFYSDDGKLLLLVRLLECRGRRGVRLGFTADDACKIVRDELPLDAKQSEPAVTP